LMWKREITVKVSLGYVYIYPENFIELH